MIDGMRSLFNVDLIVANDTRGIWFALLMNMESIAICERIARARTANERVPRSLNLILSYGAIRLECGLVCILIAWNVSLRLKRLFRADPYPFRCIHFQGGRNFLTIDDFIFLIKRIYSELLKQRVNISDQSNISLI